MKLTFAENSPPLYMWNYEQVKALLKYYKMNYFRYMRRTKSRKLSYLWGKMKILIEWTTTLLRDAGKGPDQPDPSLA